MTFATAVGNLNDAVVRHLADDGPFTYTRAEGPWTSFTIAGILKSGSEVEDIAPGDGSTYALLWVLASVFTVAPVAGDEVASSTYVYKIVRLLREDAGGLWLLLRQDRAVT